MGPQKESQNVINGNTQNDRPGMGRPRGGPQPPSSRKRLFLALALAAGVFFAYKAFWFTVSPPPSWVVKTPGDHLSLDAAHGGSSVEFRGAGGDRILLWDWGDEDGDAVKVAGETVTLRNGPAAVALPLQPGTTVEVLGVKDGRGGGVTVGVSVPGAYPQVQVMRLRPGQTGHVNIR